MKKSLKLLSLTIVLLLTLSACGTNVRGEVTGNTYENAFIGIGCKLDGWTFYTDEQIAEMNNETAYTMGEEYAEALDDETYIYDMHATSGEDGRQTISVSLQKLTATQSALYDEKSFVEVQMDMFKADMGSMGLQNVKTSVTEKKIADKAHAALEISGSTNGVAFYEVLIAIERPGYMATVTIGSAGTNDIDAIIESFYAI